MENNRSYRIRTTVGRKESYKIDVPLSQTYDVLEVLSLKLQQKNEYNFYDSDYGIVAGRVVVNGGVGLPNAKISVFIESDGSGDLNSRLLYNFSATNDTDADGVRYNLLPDFVDNACHQDVGTFPNKRLVLDNKDMLEVFDKYYKYTTVTNESGDFMLFGIPTGSCTLHADCDLSDIGQLSQRPRDMVYKGYNINQFESPNKFKQSTNLNSLSQIYSQDKGVFVYPYWGNRGNGDNGNVAITRCDIEIEYKIEPTCVFMGSIISDKGSNSINQHCNAGKNSGRMSELIGGSGSIEIIRKTIDNKVEELQIKGNRVIDSDGVWCYQIPMNLDYVTTDEFGNVVPTDDPSKGIPTRARVRFRISMDESVNDVTATKRCKYLVPNNPRLTDDYPVFKKTKEVDYEFGSATRDEDFRDLFWNNVYTVKNYIPRLQKNRDDNTRNHTGIKWINHGDNVNQMPYNSLTIKLGFMYRLICVLTKVIINLIEFINQLVSMVGAIICLVRIIIELPGKILGKLPLIGGTFKRLWNGIMKWPLSVIDLITPPCIGLSSEFCNDEINRITYYPGCGQLIFNLGTIPSDLNCSWKKTQKVHFEKEKKELGDDFELEWTTPTNKTAMLYTCVENNLAQDNDVTSFNFYDDWVNGVLYMPLWYRKITPKKSFFFGLFRKKAKDQWCSNNMTYNNLFVTKVCALDRNGYGKTYKNFKGEDVIPYINIDANTKCGKKGKRCHEETSTVSPNNGIVVDKKTMLGQTVYYYKPVEYDKALTKNKYTDESGEVKLFFATDIVLLGSLNDCDLNGVPQFFKHLTSTTYMLPSDILFTDQTSTISYDENGNAIYSELECDTVETGCDWGNNNDKDQCGSPDGGLFYSIGCSTIEMIPKSCINITRLCEFGTSKDVIQLIGKEQNDKLVPDGFVSKDELYDLEGRSMFATMNGNNLKTKLNNKNGLQEYDFFYLYPDNYDGTMSKIMEQRQKNACKKNVTYKDNYNMEVFCSDYYQFRMGQTPYFYENDGNVKRFPRYENSFYFYFGINSGKTAIEKFNSDFFATCEDSNAIGNSISIETQGNSFNKINDNKPKGDYFIKIDVGNIALPYEYVINSLTDKTFGIESEEPINDEKIIICTEDYYNKNKDEIDGEGYKPIFVDEMENGEYSITITDANGEIVETTFILETPYLKYNVGVEHFKVSNIELDEKYKSNFNTIANEKNRGDIDGYILIDNIFQGNEVLKNFKVEVMTDDVSYEYPKIEFINGVEVSRSGKGILEVTSVEDGKSAVIKIGCGYGECEYIITVTELEEPGLDTLNSVQQNVFVKEGGKYKMYINTVDYDLIKHWKAGSGENNLWLRMSDKENYNWETTSEVRYYAREIRKILKNYNANVSISNLINILSEGVKNGLNIDIILSNIVNDVADHKEEVGLEIKPLVEAWLNFTNEIIITMRNNFRLLCENSPASLYLKAESNIVIEYSINGQEEIVETTEEGDDFYKVNNEKPKEMSPDGNVYYVEDIHIPTITTTDSERFGSNNIVEGKICFVNDNEPGSGYRKYPYSILIKRTNDGKEETIPKVKRNPFEVHFIDKLFSVETLAWACMTNIPYYEGENAGGFINMPGFVAGKILNGNIIGEDENGVQFEEQSVGNISLHIKNVGEDTEDSMPTRRFIYSKDEEIKYEKYKVYTEEDTAPQNQIIKPLSEDLIISSNSCSVSKLIYGGMNISLADESMEDGNEQSNNVLSFTLKNGPSGENINYYIYKLDNNVTYPLNSVQTNGIVVMSNNKWDGGNGQEIFSYVTTEDVLKEKCLGNAPIASDANKIILNKDVLEIQKGDKIFIVAVAADNNRCLSPVFDYSSLNVNATVEEGSINEDIPGIADPETGETTSTTVTYKSYIINFKFGEIVPYYIKNYPIRRFTFKCEIPGLLQIDCMFENIDNNAESIGKYEITEENYNIIRLSMDKFIANSIIEVVDYVGLKHTKKGI